MRTSKTLIGTTIRSYSPNLRSTMRPAIDIIYPTWPVTTRMDTFQTSTKTRQWSRIQKTISLMATTKWSKTYKASIITTIQWSKVLTTLAVPMCQQTVIQQINWIKYRAKSSSKAKLISLRRLNPCSIEVELKTRTSQMIVTLSNKTTHSDRRMSRMWVRPRSILAIHRHVLWDQVKSILKRANNSQLKLQWLRWRVTPIYPWLRKKTSRSMEWDTCK